MVATVVPGAERLPDVLPTDRLSAAGRPAPQCEGTLRRIPDERNAVTVIGAWVQSFGVVAAAAVLDRWWAYLVAFLLMGRAFALLNILGHEAAHRLLFSRRRINDLVGRWLLAYPAFLPFDLYRRSHMAHHRDEMGPEEPDLALYSGYPIPPASMRRKLIRDAVGISGWKNLSPLLLAAWRGSSAASGRPDTGRPGCALGRVLACQRALVAVPAVVAGPVDDRLAGAQPVCAPLPSTPAWSAPPTGAGPPTWYASGRSLAFGWFRTTPGGTWPTTSTVASRGETCRGCTPNWLRPAGSPPTSSTPAIWRSGGRWPRVAGQRPVEFTPYRG